MKHIRSVLLVLLAFMALLPVSATERFVFFKPQQGALSLAGATIGYSDQEPKAVQIAAANLQQDIQRVMGFAPKRDDSPTILIGTVGCNSRIDQLVKQQVLKDLKGKREKYIIATVDNQVVIAGSDRRGTVYGIYELSQQMGVSPWYWWMDVPVKHRDYVGVVPGSSTPPASVCVVTSTVVLEPSGFSVTVVSVLVYSVALPRSSVTVVVTSLPSTVSVSLVTVLTTLLRASVVAMK